MQNKLKINRLIIITNNGKVAYDEKFHAGVNIIRGENSSGKSTITHFIFYILGGAFNDWVKEAKKCASVMAEVELNGATVVLKREININPNTGKGNDKESLYIYWGSLQELESKKGYEWQKFGFNTTTDRKSYSNVLFENLNLPIVKGDNNITIHQILRLIYIDQDSPTSSLFLYEQFDSSLTRETVADLLLGVYDQTLYDQKQRNIDAEKELDEVAKEIKVIKKFIANPHDLDPIHLRTRIENKEKEILGIEEEIVSFKEKTKTVRYSEKSRLDFQNLNEISLAQRNIVNKLSTDITTLKLEIDDSRDFIEVLEKKLKAIKNSIVTRDFLGEFPLEYCPDCLSKLDTNDDPTNCKLCKKHIDDTFGVTQARKIEQDLSFQIKESKTLLTKKERSLLDLSAQFESEKVKLYQIQTQVNTALNDVKSYREEKIDKLYVDKGFIEGEIIQLRTLLENAELYQSLVKSESLLTQELASLDASIKKLTAAQDRLKVDIKNTITAKGLYLLNNDLRRQKDFYEAKEFNIDFRNNIAFISDKDAKYSASSNFYLKNSARFAIFLCSLEVDRMRYPRFILSDNMEDKGIEKERAQNFQRILIQEANKHDVNSFQIIYTTSFIPDELEGSEYCVGEYYTETNPSLKNV